MKLKIVYSSKNMVFRLINVDAQASEKSSNRVLACWSLKSGSNMRVTYWKNDMISTLNPYKYNRVNVHYTNDHMNNKVTESYYCIEEIIKMEDMTFEDFDDGIVKFKETISEIRYLIIFMKADFYIFNSNCKWNIGGTFSINDWNKLAYNFWKGVDFGNFEDEKLFVGRIIIDEVIPPSI